MYKKLFIPGPTHVRDEILQAQAVGMIGHRAKEYSDLQAAVTPKLQELLYTEQRVYLYASSSSGVMEGSVRQASKKRVLCTVCGAFSKRWYQITVDNGVPCDKVDVPMGQAITVDLVDEALSQGDYDAITLCHNETSTGIMNPIQEIAEMIHASYPDVLILVATTSGATGLEAARLFSGVQARVVAVSHSTGFHLPDSQELSAESRQGIEAAGAIVLTCQHAFGGVGRAVRKKLGSYQVDEIMAYTLRTFGQGMKVAAEICLMAADAGLAPTSEPVIAIGGTGGGADTAAVIRPSNAQTFFDLRFLEIICMPSLGHP